MNSTRYRAEERTHIQLNQTISWISSDASF